MNWDSIGAIGEIVGALAVVFSLIYLATQVRIQNSESRAKAINDVATMWHYMLGDIANDSEMAVIWTKAMRNIEELDETEKARFFAKASSLFKMVEGFHYQWLNKKLSEETWSGLKNAVTDVCAGVGTKVWWANRRHWYGTDFQGFVDSCMSGSGRPIQYKDLRGVSVRNDT